MASDMELYEIVPIVMKTSFFRDLGEKKFFIESLRRMKIETYERNKPIYEEAKEGSALYILLDGTVELVSSVEEQPKSSRLSSRASFSQSKMARTMVNEERRKKLTTSNSYYEDPQLLSRNPLDVMAQHKSAD